MKLLKTTTLIFCMMNCLLPLTHSSIQNQADCSVTNLNAITNVAQKISQNCTNKYVNLSTRGEATNPLLQFFTLIGYIKTMLEITQTYYENHSEEPTIRCKNCQKRLVPACIFFTSLTAIALRDIADGKNTYDQMKTILDEAVLVLPNQSPEEIKNFMVLRANDIKFPCSDCKTNFWESSPRNMPTTKN